MKSYFRQELFTAEANFSLQNKGKPNQNYKQFILRDYNFLWPARVMILAQV